MPSAEGFFYLIQNVFSDMEIKITNAFLDRFTTNEQLVMIQLLLTADEYGVVEFSDRVVSRKTNIPYQQVRTIHQKLLREKVLINAQSNAATNAKQNFVTFCKSECYGGFKRKTNAEYNATANAIESFENIWQLYGKKVGRTKKLVKKWCELPDEDRRKIFEFVPAYVSLTEESFRKQFSTFLNQRAWENEKIYTHNIAVPFGSFNPKLVEDRNLFPQFVERFNMKVHGSGIIEVNIPDGLTEKRRILFNIAYCLHFHKIKRVIENAISNPRLNGSSGFAADFDYIFEPDNFIRIYEGR